MRVNAIELFLQQEQFSNEEKKKLLQYSSKVAIFLFMNEVDLENLDGNYYLHQDELESVIDFHERPSTNLAADSTTILVGWVL